jgi:hypothetical protein
MGVLGLVSFWALMSMVIIRALYAIRTVRDNFIRVAVVFALAAVFAELFTGYVDVGLENYRNLVVFGVLFAVISRAPYLAGQAAAPIEENAAVTKRRAIAEVKETVGAGAAGRS